MGVVVAVLDNFRKRTIEALTNHLVNEHEWVPEEIPLELADMHEIHVAEHRRLEEAKVVIENPGDNRYGPTRADKR